MRWSLVVVLLFCGCDMLAVENDPETAADHGAALRRACPTGTVRQGNKCVQPSLCGDTACNGVETCESCASDCGACPTTCGDGACDAAEDCNSCSNDCGGCGPVASTPYGGTPASLPGTLVAAFFDHGGEGVAFHDSTTGNLGDAGFRNPTDVDIKVAGTSGYALGWMEAGEWLSYSVNVQAAGTYLLKLRVASGDPDGGSVRVSFGGADKTGALFIPATGGYAVWTTAQTQVQLAAGAQVMRIDVLQGWFDLASIEVATAGCASCVTIAPGESWQTKVDANPAGTRFRVLTGTHRRASLVPKTGNQFLGDAGAVMDGENATTYAFQRGSSPYPSGVRIQNIIIERYVPPPQFGAIMAGNGVNDGGADWVIQDCEIRYNATGGVRIADGMQLLRNNIHHNHQEGIVGVGDDVLVEGNEIAWNNYLKEFDWGWEAGGTKFVLTNRLVVRGNYSHDNWGPGLWSDIDNMNVLYENNRVEDNAGPGIFHEISHDAVIRNNTVTRNGFDFAGWVWGGGIQIATSDNVEIYGNTVEDNKVGISIVAQPRGSGIYGVFQTRNVNVHDNLVTQHTGELSAAAHSPADDTWYSSIHFANNSYFTPTTNPSLFCWLDGQYRTWAQWKGYGNDVNGSLTIIP
jgi:parallel beta-helix repeat protein